jgi:hypothetical protein
VFYAKLLRSRFKNSKWKGVKDILMLLENMIGTHFLRNRFCHSVALFSSGMARASTSYDSCKMWIGCLYIGFISLIKQE